MTPHVLRSQWYCVTTGPLTHRDTANPTRETSNPPAYFRGPTDVRDPLHGGRTSETLGESLGASGGPWKPGPE